MVHKIITINTFSLYALHLSISFSFKIHSFFDNVLNFEFLFKVRMYVYSVNGKIVLAMNHDEVANLILQGMVVDLVVLQHVRGSGT